MAWLRPRGQAAGGTPAGSLTWGDLHPSRRCRWESTDEGVTLLVPRFGEGLVARTLGRFVQARPYKAHLDDVGAFVWHRCDGATSVSDIARAMRSEFGERVEPVEDRLVSFLKKLSRGRFVSLDPGAAVPADQRPMAEASREG